MIPKSALEVLWVHIWLWDTQGLNKYPGLSDNVESEKPKEMTIFALKSPLYDCRGIIGIRVWVEEGKENQMEDEFETVAL